MPDELKLGHDPVLPPRLVTNVPRLDPMWFDRFARFSSCDLADVVGPLYTMSGDIRPAYEPIPRVVGQALTAKAWPGDNLAVHGALSIAQSGDVLVVDWRGYVSACGAGAQVLAEPFDRGLRGVVVDGAWRDLDDLRAHKFPVFAKAMCAYSPPKQQPGEINVTVACGGVVVEPGDLVIADADGVAVVPQRHLELVWEHVRETRPWSDDPQDRDQRAANRRAYYQNKLALAGGVTD
jgi:4-hydroxy-4-methyl-2-oxoglutarate aldolase